MWLEPSYPLNLQNRPFFNPNKSNQTPAINLCFSQEELEVSDGSYITFYKNGVKQGPATYFWKAGHK